MLEVYKLLNPGLRFSHSRPQSPRSFWPSLWQGSILPQARRIVGSGDENAFLATWEGKGHAHGNKVAMATRFSFSYGSTYQLFIILLFDDFHSRFNFCEVTSAV